MPIMDPLTEIQTGGNYFTPHCTICGAKVDGDPGMLAIHFAFHDRIDRLEKLITEMGKDRLLELLNG